MGTFAFSLHIKSTDQAAVAASLDALHRRQGYDPTEEPVTVERGVRGHPARRAFWLTSAENGWVSLLDSARYLMGELAQELSAYLSAPALHTFVYDSDAWGFVLYHEGVRVADFTSNEGDNAVASTMPKSRSGGHKTTKRQNPPEVEPLQQQLAQLQQALAAAMPPAIAAIHAKRLASSATAEEQERYNDWMAGAFGGIAGNIFSPGGSGSAGTPGTPATSEARAEAEAGSEASARHGASAEQLRRILAPEIAVDEVLRVLARHSPFAEEDLAVCLRLLGIRPEFAGLRYEHMRDGPDVSWLPQLPALRYLAFRRSLPC